MRGSASGDVRTASDPQDGTTPGVSGCFVPQRDGSGSVEARGASTGHSRVGEVGRVSKVSKVSEVSEVSKARLQGPGCVVGWRKDDLHGRLHEARGASG